MAKSILAKLRKFKEWNLEAERPIFERLKAGYETIPEEVYGKSTLRFRNAIKSIIDEADELYQASDLCNFAVIVANGYITLRSPGGEWFAQSQGAVVYLPSPGFQLIIGENVEVELSNCDATAPFSQILTPNSIYQINANFMEELPYISVAKYPLPALKVGDHFSERPPDLDIDIITNPYYGGSLDWRTWQDVPYDDLSLILDLKNELPPYDPCSRYPGWVNYSDRSYRGEIRCVSYRTMYIYPPEAMPDVLPTPEELMAWWQGLSELEKAIEAALAATNTDDCRSKAPFDHIEPHTVTFVLGWISSNASKIIEVAGKLRVDPALVAGLLASEMLFDYGGKDFISDISARGPLPVSMGGGYGYSNAHQETRQYASDYLQQFIDSDTVSPVSPVGDVPEDWLTTDTGAIITAAIIARWLVDPYTNQIGIGYSTARVLTAEDMAVIFTAYRAGIRGWSPTSDTYAFDSVREYREILSDPELPCNAQLALPIMRYMKTIFP